MTTTNMREKGVKSILKSKKNENDSCPRPAISLHLALLDAFPVSTRQSPSDVGTVFRGSRASFTPTQ
jgi:hypothetical protein